jgi:tetratricopeptide (TPR) repeat protein
MKRPALLLATVFCFLAILPALLPVSAKDNWVSVRSKNFFLVGNASEKEIRQVGRKLEQFRGALSVMFPNMNFNSPVPTTVVVFKSDSAYRPFKPKANTAGYFQPGPDVNYITLTAEARGNQDQYSIIFHEFTHLLVNNNSSNVPTWLSEGLAEVYSTLSIADDQKVLLGKPITEHVLLLREKKMLPLGTLFQVDHQSPYYNERDKQSIFYAESWALMHYLTLARKGERVPQISKFLELVSANAPMEQAFQQAFGMGFERMENELREYIIQDRYPVVSGHFESKLAVDTALQSALITEAEAQAYLGDLLVHSNRDDAEVYLQKALSLDPNLAMAHASMGMLRVRQGKSEEARQSLERAVAANSQNYLIHYYYAFALSREGSNDAGLLSSFAPGTVEKMRAHLKKAIELRPDYPESYGLLAFVNLVNGTDLDETVAFLERTIAKSPGRNDLVYMLAQVYLRKEDFQTARELLEKLSGANVEAQVRQRAQSLLAQVGPIEGVAAKNRALMEMQSKGTGHRASQTDSGSVVGESEAIENLDPSYHLRDALRKPLAGETQVQGLLMRIDCEPKVITFVVKVGDRLLKLKTAGFGLVDMTSFSSDAGHEITCGPRTPENNVVMNFQPASDARANTHGVLKSIEFVPQDFKLKPTP